MTEGIATAAKSASQTSLIVAIAMQVGLKQFLKNIWPLFNVTQLIIVLAIMPVDLPPNGEMVFLSIKDALELNAIPKEAILGAIAENPSV